MRGDGLGRGAGAVVEGALLVTVLVRALAGGGVTGANDCARELRRAVRESTKELFARAPKS